MQLSANPEATSSPDVLGILITSKCNLVCRHCCNDSHPLNAGALPFEEIAHVIEMARDVPSIREVGISGGEPFLFVPLLTRVIKFAASQGFSSSVTTNGFWARSSERSSLLLSELKASGLCSINVSTSVFHQEFVALATVVNALEMTLLAGLKATLNVVSTSSFSAETVRVILGRLPGTVEVVEMPCVPAGRGGTMVHPDEFVRECASPHGNCKEHFKKLAVDPLGNVYPCCSPGGFTGPLRMGNVRNASLQSILEASARSQLLAILESAGPQFFLPFLRSAGVGPPLPAKFSDQCHLCNVILSSDSYAETIENAAAQLFSGLASIGSPQSSATGDRLSKLIEERRASAGTRS